MQKSLEVKAQRLAEFEQKEVAKRELRVRNQCGRSMPVGWGPPMLVV